MTPTTAKTVDEYLASLTPERREVMATVRKTVKKHLPKGFVEGMHYGMIYYHIPFSRLAETYNGQPLCYAGLAAQKNHYALYLMGAYGSEAAAKKLKDGFKNAGKKLDMGKSCLRFKSVSDLPLDVVGDCIASMSAEEYIAHYERSRLMTKAGARKAARKAAPRKS
jgi:hypothetical protein